MLAKWFKHKEHAPAPSNPGAGSVARTLPLRQIPASIVDDAVNRLPASPADPDARATTSAHVQGRGLVQLVFAWTVPGAGEAPHWELIDAQQARQDLFTSKAEFPAHVRERLDG